MTESKNVYSGYFSLTPEQRRFRIMLSAYGRLLPFWNFDTRECDVESLRLEMDDLSCDERQMARFFVTMWQPENVLQFDVTSAIWTLGDAHWQVIQQWLSTLESPQVSLRMTHSMRS